MIANNLGHFESQEACIEVDGALEVAHFEVRVADFCFVCGCHSVITSVSNEKGTNFLTLLYHPASPSILSRKRLACEPVNVGADLSRTSPIYRPSLDATSHITIMHVMCIKKP